MGVGSGGDHVNREYCYQLITISTAHTVISIRLQVPNCICLVFSHVKAVRNMMSYHGNDTNFVQGEYHIGSFRGYGARMDDK